MAFDTSGNLFVAEFGAGIIDKFTPNGVQSTFASGMVNPIGLAFASTGDLFVSDFGSGIIYAYSTAGVQTKFASGLNHPAGITFSTPVPFEFSPEQGFILGVPLFLGLRYLKKKKAAK